MINQGKEDIRCCSASGQKSCLSGIARIPQIGTILYVIDNFKPIQNILENQRKFGIVHDVTIDKLGAIFPFNFLS